MKSHPKTLRTTFFPIVQSAPVAVPFTIGTNFLKQTLLTYSFAKSFLLKASKIKKFKAPSRRRRKKPAFVSFKLKASFAGTKSLLIPILLKRYSGFMVFYVLSQILLTVVPLLLAVAFLTLCERKIMGAMQRRVGPNVNGFAGLLQPFWDGLKLFLKEPIMPSAADRTLFFWAPILTFLTSQAIWAALPTSSAGAISDLKLGTMYFLAVGSIGVYGVLLAGWASNSKYAFLGCCRTVAQMVSYELPLGLVVLTVCVLAQTLNWSALIDLQQQGQGWFVWSLWPLVLAWGICTLAETQRTPFDLQEDESCLVAGFFVEYSSGPFALFFIAEYANLIMMSAVTVLLFFGGFSAPFAFLSFIPGSFWFYAKTGLFLFTLVWVRATLPRYRYDQLQRLCWKALLPLTLAGFVANAAIILFFQSISTFSFDSSLIAQG